LEEYSDIWLICINSYKFYEIYPKETTNFGTQFQYLNNSNNYLDLNLDKNSEKFRIEIHKFYVG